MPAVWYGTIRPIKQKGSKNNTMREEIQGVKWESERMLPAFQTPSHLDIYDLRGASHDVRLTFATLAGLVNRPQPRVYVLGGEDDLFWLQQCLHTIPQTQVTARNDAALDALLHTYRDVVRGLVIYDPGMLDSINVATMIAGQRDVLVVSPTQSYTLQTRYHLPVVSDLRDYHWHSRLQAYQWAQQHLLPEASSRLLAGFDPTNVDHLRSFLVATRTFIYWLDARHYLPTWREGLLSERCLMRQILNSFAPGSAHLGWFIDENSGVSLTSQAALPVLASDHCTNLEVWTATQPVTAVHFMPQEDDVQAHLRSYREDAHRVYVSFTLSEGDNLQYCQHRMQDLWSDTARGSVPIGWTISPVLAQAAPALAAYYQQTATPNDAFIAGPSGAGYIFPSQWPAEQFAPYLARTGYLMQAMHLTLLEVLDVDFLQGSGLLALPWLAFLRHRGMVFDDAEGQRRYVEALRVFGLRGILSGAGVPHKALTLVDGFPIYRNLGLAGSVAQTVRFITRAAATHKERPLFLNVYILAWNMTPSDLAQVMQQLGDGYTCVLPGDLLVSARKSINNS